jgi:hypothetical protein
MSARLLPGLLLPIVLGACGGGGPAGAVLTGSNDAEHNPFPANYKAETLAFLRTYLNVPSGVREAGIAEPVMKSIAGSTRYAACLRYNAKTNTGEYGGAKEHLAVFYVGRFDQFIENGRELCAGATYQPFPELERLTR